MATEPPVFDVVILGASGFTGKYVLREFLHCMSQAQCKSPTTLKPNHDASLAGSAAPHAAVWPSFSLALAGRNVVKLQETLAWAVATAPQSAVPTERALQQIEFIEANAPEADAMDALCRRSRVLVNCVGPCLLYGETIVAACVKAGVHYLDISGEAEFMEKMEVKYGASALENRALIVSACGAVSAISDLGLLFHLRHWPLEAVPSSVDAYACFESFSCNYAASAETGFLALGNADQLATFRLTAPRRPKLKIHGSTPKDKGKFVHCEETLGVWATPIPICDRAVVRRTFWGLHGHPAGLPLLDDTSTPLKEREKIWKPIRPVHYRVFFGAQKFKNALLFSVMTQIVAVIATYTWGRKLLLKFTEFFTMGKFTRKGPTEEDMEKTKFNLWFVGQGDSYKTNLKEVTTSGHNTYAKNCDMKVVTRVRGPEPAYITSAINIVQNAMLLIHERSNLPLGGVLTTATAFGGSHVQQLLESRGLIFEHITTHVGSKLSTHSTFNKLASLRLRSCVVLFLLLVLLLLYLAITLFFIRVPA